MVSLTNQINSSSSLAVVNFNSPFQATSLRSRAALMPTDGIFNNSMFTKPISNNNDHHFASSSFFNLEEIHGGHSQPMIIEQEGSSLASTYDGTTMTSADLSHFQQSSMTKKHQSKQKSKKSGLLGRRRQADHLQSQNIPGASEVLIYELCKSFKDQMNISESLTSSRHLRKLHQELQNQQKFEPSNQHIFVPDQYALQTHLRLKKREEKEMLVWQKNAKQFEKQQFEQICRTVRQNVHQWSNQDNLKKMRRAIEEQEHEEKEQQKERVRKVKQLKTLRQADCIIVEDMFKKLNQKITNFYISQEQDKLDGEFSKFVIDKQKIADQQIVSMKQRAQAGIEVKRKEMEYQRAQAQAAQVQAQAAQVQAQMQQHVGVDSSAIQQFVANLKLEKGHYMVPNDAIVQRNLKLKEDYLKYDSWFKQHSSKLMIDAGQILGDKVNKFLNLRFNQISRPSDNENPHAVFQKYESLINEIITNFNQKRFNEDIFKMLIYEIAITKVTDLRLLKAPDGDKHWDVLIDFQAELFTRIHFQFPQLNIKELIISKCFAKNCFLLPRLPEQIAPNDKRLQVTSMGILLNSQNGKREDYKTTQSRLEKWSNALFCQFRCQALIGRAWQFLIIYVNMPKRQMSAQVIHQILYVTGDKLLLAYRKAFVDVLKQIQSKWLVEYKTYLDDPNGMIKEVQNEPEFIEEQVNWETTGLDLVKHYNRRINERIEELMKHHQNPQFRGIGRFADYQF